MMMMNTPTATSQSERIGQIEITVLTPSAASPSLERACRSVMRQQLPPNMSIRHLVIADGKKYETECKRLAMAAYDGAGSTPRVYSVPDNTHKGEWYGHRIYANYSQMIDADYIAFLDEDNEHEPNHIATLVEKAATNGFAYSKRLICTEGGELIGLDDFESVGVPIRDGAGNVYALVDTSTWMFRVDHIAVARAIEGKWGADRALTQAVTAKYGERRIMEGCTGLHTMRYYAPDRLEAYFRANCTAIGVFGVVAFGE